MTDEQRRTLALATLVEDVYVDRDAARRIAAEVRDWDEPVGEPPFAAWTSALRRHDRHLAVAASPPSPRAPSPGDERGPWLARATVEGVGVLRIARLDDPDAAGRRAQLEAAMRWLAGHDAAILDLRGNGGGWPTMVELVAGALFGAESVHVLDFHSRDGVERSMTVPWPDLPALARTPVAVLVDGGTASAAESLAVLLSTTGRGLVVGARTAGAANPGAWFDAGSGVWAFVPTGMPVDPRTGEGWEGVGVPLDVEVDPVDAERVAIGRLRTMR